MGLGVYRSPKTCGIKKVGPRGQLLGARGFLPLADCKGCVAVEPPQGPAGTPFSGPHNQWAIVSQESELPELGRAKEQSLITVIGKEYPQQEPMKSHIWCFQKAPQCSVQETIKRITVLQCFDHL